MKKFLNKTVVNVIRMQIMLSFIAAIFCVRGSEIFTNWNGFAFGLVLPQTNMVAGTNVLASIVVSNTTETTRIMRYSGTVCDCGLGTFKIVDMSSGKLIECAMKSMSMGSSAFGLQGHKSQTFDFDLKTGYGLTKPGDYLVRASGWFPLQEPPNGQLTNVVTLPIIISLTNAPPK